MIRRLRCSALLAFPIAVVAALFSVTTLGLASRPYELRDDRIHLLGWDDVDETSNSGELLKLQADVFSSSANVFRQRALIEEDPVVSTEFTVPTSTTQVILSGRSQPESDIFPRLRVILELVGTAGGGSEPYIIYEGYVQSLGIQKISMPLPSKARGCEARLRIEILNPSRLNDTRVYYFASLSFHGPGGSKTSPE